MLGGDKARKLLVPLLLLVILTVTGVVAAVPFSTPMGGFWRDAQQFATTGHISSVFTPCGYPALLGLGFRAAGKTGIVAIQLLLYLLIVAAIYAILRLLRVDPTVAMMGASLLGLHPELVISIKKIWDTDITTALLLSLCAPACCSAVWPHTYAGRRDRYSLGLEYQCTAEFPRVDSAHRVCFLVWCFGQGKQFDPRGLADSGGPSRVSQKARDTPKFVGGWDGYFILRCFCRGRCQRPCSWVFLCTAKWAVQLLCGG
jgi:hypothetical protein